MCTMRGGEEGTRTRRQHSFERVKAGGWNTLRRGELLQASISLKKGWETHSSRVSSIDFILGFIEDSVRFLSIQ